MQTFGGISLQPSFILRRALSVLVGAAIAATTALVVAPAPAHADAAQASVAGRVTLDGTPTGGLTVCAGGAIHGDQGYQNYGDCTTTAPDGTYAVSFDFPGSTNMASVWVDPGTEYRDVFPQTSYGEYRPGHGGYISLAQGYQLTAIDIALASYPVIRGVVVDDAGAPVDGASVSAGVNTVVTAADGSYAVPARTSYDGGQVSATADGFLPGGIHLSSSGATHSTTIVLTRIEKAPEPLSVGVPTISGVLRVGKKLSAAARVTGAATPQVSYRWYRNGAAIAGAAKATYRLTARDVRKKITVAATVRVPGQNPVRVISAPTAKIAR